MEEQILTCYEALSAATGRMLSASQARDLPALETAEAECAAQIDRLRQLGDGPQLSPAGRQRKIALIRGLLADDARIRELTEPWMAGLAEAMNQTARQRRVEAAYA